MLSDGKTKLTITFIITISLLIYHTLNLYKPEDSNIFAIYKIAQFAFITTTTFYLLYNKFLSKIILREDYIGGNYTGTSHYYIKSPEKADQSSIERKNILNFQIKQDFTSVKITGKSLKSNAEGGLNSTWTGTLFKQDDNTFYFALELSSNTNEFGILKLSFQDTAVHGFYYSGEPNTPYAFQVTCQKIDK